MNNFKLELADKINMLKGYECSHSSNCKDKIIIDNDGRRFVITIKEIQEPDEDMLREINTYLG